MPAQVPAAGFYERPGFFAALHEFDQSTAGVLLLGAEIEGKLGNDSGRAEFVNQLLSEFPDSPEARKALSSG